MPRETILHAAVLAIALSAAGAARADAVTDWNAKTGEFIADARMGTPPAVRLMALVQTAVARAVEAGPKAGAAQAAAVAAAHRAVLVKLLPAAQHAAVEAAYQAAIGSIGDAPAQAAGIAAGERAAAEILAQRADDNAAAPEAYRPHVVAGVYVPTAMPAVPQWPQRKPWMMTSAAQFRPAAPPALTSVRWERDFLEVQSLGGRTSTGRTPEQTEIARFWDYSLPAVYHGVVRSVALQQGRSVAANARLYAAVAQAMDDALIAVFEAKYHHHFWRPATAIRNADLDGLESTARDASWAPLIDAPMHPEYPSGHSILASAVAVVLEGETKGAALPVLSTTSPTGKGATRTWTSLDAFVREVSNARIWGGIHFRSATEAGEAMGRQIGALAVDRHLRVPH